MNLRGTVIDVVMRSGNWAHRRLLGLTKGRVGSSFRRTPIIELHTTGRATGKRRSTTLMVPVREGNRLVLVASRGGDDRHPYWYTNLVANPDVEVTFRGETRAMRARTASDEEKARLWPQVVNAYGGYGNYQKRTSRDIPLVICEPRGSGATGWG